MTTPSVDLAAPPAPAAAPAAEQAPVRAPHVVLVVGNPVDHDARVRKTALSLAAAGLRVTVVDTSTDRERHDRRLEDLVDVVDVPVEYLLRNRHTERRRFRRWLLAPLGYGNYGVYRAEGRRRTVADWDLMADMGRGIARGDYADKRAPRSLLARGRRHAWRLNNRVRRKITWTRGALQRYYAADPPWLAEARARTVVGPGAWRRVLPEYLDLEAAFAPVLDELAPDLIHANDVNMIGLTERAVARARLKGREVRWLYDAHEFVPGMARYRRDRIAAMAAHEKEYIGRADAVLTVSEPIAEAIQSRCALAERPVVVLNAPSLARPVLADPPSVRAAAGLGPDVPLIVYSGNIDPDRGITQLVEALAHLPGVHAAIVTNAPHENWYLTSLREIAEQGGYPERLHLVPYVPGDRIIEYLSSATLGMHGLNHVPNHEMALPNKYFDYMHSRLPVVVSDVRAMAELTTAIGNGEVYRAGDAVDLAAAAKKVLADVAAYRRPLEDDALLREWSWERQEEKLHAVYGRLLGRPVVAGSAVAEPA